jgi:hypothetical protein
MAGHEHHYFELQFFISDVSILPSSVDLCALCGFFTDQKTIFTTESTEVHRGRTEDIGVGI